MAPKLYMHPASGPSRAVLLCAKYIGLELDLEIVDLFAAEQLTPAFQKVSVFYSLIILIIKYL